jgi:uncharacterized protein (UPF0261 family)
MMAQGITQILMNLLKKVIGFGTIGGTEACVRNCISHMNVKEIEAVVYHTNGTGGMALEDAAREGFLSGIIDVSICELVDHLCASMQEGGNSAGVSFPL